VVLAVEMWSRSSWKKKGPESIAWT
jgi:hypothetical protein